MLQHTGYRPHPTPCLRHPRVWLASCTDCTDWHLARQTATRSAALRAVA